VGDTLRDWGWVQVESIGTNELLKVSRVRLEPGKGRVSDVEGGLKTGEEGGVVDGVKGCTAVQLDDVF